MELDKLHYDFSRIDGYNKPFNFVVSEREDGKTTAFHVTKAFKAFREDHRPTIIFRRMVVDITDAYIDSLENIINKFNDKSTIHFTYKQQSKKDGVVDLNLDGEVAYRIVALSLPMSRIKSLFLKDPAYILFDEFICNTRMGEKYLSEEAFKIKEVYNTFYRECSSTLKCYFLANPYSLYCPEFVEFGIDPKKLMADKIISGENYAAEFHELKPELKAKILEKNPLYKFEDAYTRYALHGQAINDENIRIMPKMPQNFSLEFVFTFEGKTIGVYGNNDFGNFDLQYYVGYIDKVGSRRDIYCFDFKDLVNKSVLFSYDDRRHLGHFKEAIRSREVAYQTLECDYFIEEVYSSL